MIYDAIIEIDCDECGQETRYDLEYKYHSYSGDSGYYDDSGLREWLESEGWEVDEDNHCVCPDCQEVE